MESITNSDYIQSKRGCKDFEIKELGDYHGLYVQSDTLLLADVIENFRTMCLKICEHHPLKFISALQLAWQAALKITKVKLDLLTHIDVLLIVEKGINGGICHYFHQYAKAKKNLWKIVIKVKTSHL